MPISLSTYPQPRNELERLHALKSYQILDSFAEKEFDRLTELAAIICNAPISLVSLLDENRQWFKSKVGIDGSETSRDLAFCSHAIMSNDIMEVRDATLDERFKNNPFVTSDPNIRFYAGVPLTDPNGYNLGTLCVLDRIPRCLNEKQQAALRLLGQAAMDLIIEQRKKQELIHFDKLVLLSNDLICIAGMDGFLKKINPAFKTLLGWEEASLLKRSIFDMVHPDDQEITHREIEKLSTGEATVNFVHRFKTRDAKYKILQWTATPEPSTGFFFAIGRDITEEKKRERLLLESESRFRSFFESSQALMCTHDLEGKLISINKSGATSLGYKVEEMKGLSLFDIVPSSQHPGLRQYLAAVIDTRQASGVMQIRHKNGQLRIWLYNNVLQDGADGEKYIIGNAVDITDRHLLEADLRRTKDILERTNRAARIGVWEFDPQRTTVYWSEVTRNIHEVPDTFDPDFETAIKFFSGKDLALITECTRQAVDKGIAYDVELQIETWNKKVIWVRCIGTPEFEKGICKRVYGTFQDINEKKLAGQKMEEDKTRLAALVEELESARKLAEQASMAKSEFLANMSHEIRTPLNGVVGFTDLVLKTNLNPTQQQYLDLVSQSANALLSVINDILDFSKIESGKLDLVTEPCDIFELGSQAADIIAYQVQKKGVEMLLNISATLPRFISADPVRLKQVLVNLLGNAAKFTERGEIELLIQAIGATTDNFTTLHFEVRDTGIGIKPEMQQKIFEAFSQEDPSTTKKYGGTGLGLTISNKLLGLMGSQLKLSSVPGKGSCFSFDLRLRTEAGEPIQWKPADLVKKVLIVDDNFHNRMILRQMLLLKNIMVEEASDGAAALRILSDKGNFDMVLMDYHMPDRDGLETSRQIREKLRRSPEDLPIILLHSSSDDESLIRGCEELKIAGRLTKPIKIQQLYEALSFFYKNETVVVAKELPTRETVSPVSCTILVAEDNPINMLLTKTIIRNILPRANVLEAADGLEVLALHDVADLIFMDVQMPNMNGLEATSKIRTMEQGRRIPIIALTAGNIKGEKEKCLAAGMDDFLAKPFAQSAIADMFQTWLPKARDASGSDGGVLALFPL